ncbi:hypothetical protein JOM56_001124, partial [Amanita muscaria]
NEHGGSVQHRSRFALQVVVAIVEAVDAKRLDIRSSPWSKYRGSSLFARN